MGDALRVLELNHVACQQAQGPAIAALGRLSAGESDQVGLLVPIQPARAVVPWVAAVQRGIQSLHGIPLACPFHRRSTQFERFRDAVAPAGPTRRLVGFEQDPSVGELPRWGFPHRDELDQ